MSFGLLNLLMLTGLAAVAIPPLIHLLNRRRYTVVDWGAMQFLQISDARRRRLLIEELLLMFLRMGLIAVMVLALAAPYAISPLFADLGLARNRDVVLVFGGSAGMGATESHEAAKRWALKFLDTLEPGDSVAILQAKGQPVPVLAEPTRDFDRARRAIESLPPPGGGCDWPEAVRQAHHILVTSERPLRDIILLGNGQRAGWADADSLGDWQALASRLPQDSAIRPEVWALNFDPKRPAHPVNWSLAPIRCKRVTAYVKQDVEFQTDLRLHGPAGYRPPDWVRLEVDGDPATRRDLPFPKKADLARRGAAVVGAESGSERRPDLLVVPLPPFKQQFKTPGSHLVTVRVKPKGGRVIRQDYAVEVLPLPVLIVDGEEPGVERRRSDFLRLALDPRKDVSREPPSAVLARVVSYRDFEGRLLDQDVDKTRPGTRPRVLILADVPRLEAAQRRAVARFRESGGVLVTLGAQAEKNRDHYNEELYREGKGWLPARLDRAERAGPRPDARPLLASFQHPALELFRQEVFGGLNDATFPRWWKVTPEGKDRPAVVARLTGRDPLLVEGGSRGGKVLLCAVPLMNSRDDKDASWDSNLVRLPAFAPLAHELVRYLAGNLAAGDKSSPQVSHNLLPGQPLYYGQDGGEAEGNWTLRAPGDRRALPLLIGNGPRRPGEHRGRFLDSTPGPRGPSVPNWPILDYADTYHTGVYTLRIPLKNNWLPAETAAFFNEAVSSRRTVYYTVRSDDPREYDLTPWSAADRAAVARQVPVTYETDGNRLLGTLSSQANTQELWWVFLAVVVLLLCFEVWMTRRIVRAR